MFRYKVNSNSVLYAYLKTALREPGTFAVRFELDAKISVVASGRAIPKGEGICLSLFLDWT